MRPSAASSPFETEPLADNEEILLKMNLSVEPGADPEDALAKVQAYTQAFPFAAVLPVQPLQYLPTHEGGVDVLFLRKKTKEKGSVDGGIRFFVSLVDGDQTTVDVEVKRNSKGQVVNKMFTEKMVIQAYSEGIQGNADDKYGHAPLEYAKVRSMFHPWM